MKYPLEGVKVLDFSRVVAGPFAGRLLSDLGADVVKVEPPEGDGTRIHGKKLMGISGMFNQQNAGKRNICLDLRKPDAVELAKELAAMADIVLENDDTGAQTEKHQRRMMREINKLVANADQPNGIGYLDPSDYNRSVGVLLASGDAVISKPPKGAWTHKVYEAMTNL